MTSYALLLYCLASFQVAIACLIGYQSWQAFVFAKQPKIGLLIAAGWVLQGLYSSLFFLAYSHLGLLPNTWWRVIRFVAPPVSMGLIWYAMFQGKILARQRTKEIETLAEDQTFIKEQLESAVGRVEAIKRQYESDGTA